MGFLLLRHTKLGSMEKKRFEVKIIKGKNGPIKRIFVDGQFFDWDVDRKSLEECKKMGPEYLAAAEKDIQKHFMESLSEFVGREITPIDLLKAIKLGWI